MHMSIRRRSTVHDFASLRLHPDGSRVQTNASGENKSHGSGSRNAKAQTTRLARYTARDAQANWVALDAGGTASIKQRHRARNPKSEEQEGQGKGKDEELAEEDEGGVGLFVGPDGSSQRRQLSHSSSASGEDESTSDIVGDVKDARAKKRKKFYHDFSFLEVLHTSPPGLPSSVRAPSSGAAASSQYAVEAEPPYSQILLPVPSSDLLKCIHHFASEYYNSRGCLFDAPKEARKARKARKLAKLRLDVAKKSGQRVLEEELVSESDGSGLRSDGNDNNRHEAMGKDNDEEDATRGRSESRKRRQKRSKEKPRRDMYKAFDGSALMAVGMLLQEHVVEMMSTEPPEHWLQQMESLKALEANGVRGGTRSRGRKKVDEDDAEEHGDSETQEEQDASDSSERDGEEDAADGDVDSTSSSSSSESNSNE